MRDELHELGKRQKEHFSSLIKEKDSQIEQLYAEKEKYEKLITAVAPSKKYANEPIIKLLKHHARKDFTAMTVEEMKQLKALFVGEEQFIKIEDMVSSNEYTVCMLIRTGFTPSDIYVLTGMSKSNIANIRKRLYTKLTGRNG